MQNLHLPENLAYQLKEALTHSSFYINDNNNKAGNSRLVFLGMFQFRGLLAEHLETFVPGTGTQLHHLLGNIISNKRLQELFDLFEFENLIRKDDKFDMEKHKHIFVFGFFGFLVKYVSKTGVINFINRYIIKPADLKNFYNAKTNMLAQLNMLHLQKYGKKPEINTQMTDDEKYITTVITENKLICSKVSKSKKYSRKAAVKKALQIIVEENHKILLNDEEYNQRIKENLRKKQEVIKKQKQEKYKSLLLKQKEKKSEREKRRKLRKQERTEKEKRRKMAKKRRKQKAGVV